jgi:hypothetical protein
MPFARECLVVSAVRHLLVEQAERFSGRHSRGVGIGVELFEAAGLQRIEFLTAK